jgi:hypothetical protein
MFRMRRQMEEQRLEMENLRQRMYDNWQVHGQ